MRHTPEFAASDSDALAPQIASVGRRYQRYLRPLVIIGVGSVVFGLFVWSAVAQDQGAVIAPGFCCGRSKPRLESSIWTAGVVGNFVRETAIRLRWVIRLSNSTATEIDASP